MKTLVVILCSLFSISALADKSPYITVDEYIKTHPKERERISHFEKVVSDIGKPINKKIESPAKIAFIYPGKQVSDYWRRSLVSFKKRMDEIGLEYKLTEHFTRPGVQIREQEVQIRNALKSDPDYLVFTLDARKHRRIIERILVKGRPKLILQNITTPLRRWEEKQPFMYVGFDHTLGSKELAEYYIRKTNGQGKYAVIFYTKGYVSEMRGKFFINYMRKHGKMKLTKAYYTDGSRKSGYKVAKKILKSNPDIKFIYACATDIALGALSAVNEVVPSKKILVNGWGGGSAELDSIKKKKMNVTVMRMNDDNGVAMAEAIKLDLIGKKNWIPKIFSGDFKIVEQKTSSSELDRLIKHAFRYSNE